MFRLVLALFFCASLSAQQTILLEGVVLNDTIEKSSLNVVNISLRKGSVTNAQGVFTIPARVNDTINISAVQYESRQFVVNKTIYDRKKISLYLVPKITQLDEVYLSNIELTGDIRKDVMSTSLKPVVTAASLGLPQNAHPTFTPEERRLYTAQSSSGGIVPIGALINAISGRTAMLKQHLAVSRLQAAVARTKNKFSDTLYMKELNIPSALIEDFVYYVFEDTHAKELVDANNALGLLEFMMQKSKPYIRLKESEKE